MRYLPILFSVAAFAQQLTPSPSVVATSKKPRVFKQEPDFTTSIDRPIEMTREVWLSDSAREGLLLSQHELKATPAPLMGGDGRLLYDYGVGVPTIVCSVLQLCEVDLEPGEKLSKDALDLGDTVRFAIETRSAGAGDSAFDYLVIKPKDTGIDTTMVAGTNKRSYYLRLVSSDAGHMTRVAFRYPEEEDLVLRAAEAAFQANEAARREKLMRPDIEFRETPPAMRNWNYKVKMHGRDAAWLKPLHIADDGVHTYLTMPEEARHRGLPVIQIRDSRGPIPVNYQWNDRNLVVDAVFERGCLLSGVGRAQQRACITNEGLNGSN
jgi:type IV secretion system protein VirB9